MYFNQNPGIQAELDRNQLIVTTLWILPNGSKMSILWK